MNVVELSESGYENGLRDGKAVAGRWEPPATTLLQKWVEVTQYVAPWFAHERPLEETLANLKKWTREDQLRYAAKLHQKKMAALPDLKVFPELKGMDQYLDEEAKGYAEGAGIDVREVYLARYSGDVWHHARGSGPDVSLLTATHCSPYYFPDTVQGPIIGQGGDDTPMWYEPFPTSPWPSWSEATVIRPPAGRGYAWVRYCNEKGLCMADGGGARYEYETKDDQTIFPVIVFYLVMRYCATVDEAVAMMVRYNLYFGRGGGNLVVGDADGKVAHIERSSYHCAVHRYDGKPVVATMLTCEDPQMRALCDTSTPFFRFGQRRLQKMREVIAEESTNLSVDTAWRAILHHDPIAPGCQHEETRLTTGGTLITLACTAMLPKQGRYVTRSALAGDDGLRYPCEVEPMESSWQF